MDMETAQDLVSHSEVDNKEMQGLNPVKVWSWEYLQPGKLARVGYKKTITPTVMHEATKRGLFYPYFADWCTKHGPLRAKLL